METLGERISVLELQVKTLVKIVWVLVIANIGKIGTDVLPVIYQNMTA